MPSSPAAVLWDFDGTLVDTEPIWAEVQLALLAEHGVSWSHERMAELVGMSAEDTAELLAGVIGDPAAAPELLRRTEDAVAHRMGSALPWLPGARRLLEEAAAAGLRGAVVTASSRKIMAPVAHLLPASIEFVVTCDDVERPKPHPDGYLEAMRRLGVSPREVLVVEDSVPGTLAALAAGAIVYAVPALARLEPHPKLQVSTTALRSTTWPELVRVWNERSR